MGSEGRPYVSTPLAEVEEEAEGSGFEGVGGVSGFWDE